MSLNIFDEDNYMKRLVYATSMYEDNAHLLELNIEVKYDIVHIKGNTILDLNDQEFFDFEQNLLLILDMHDFDLEEAYQSNRPNSASQYYILTKTNEEGNKLRVYVKLRVSDHSLDPIYKDGKLVSYKKRDIEHVKKEAQKLAYTKYGQKRGYAPRRIDIIFDDNHYRSYEKALQAIEKQLDEFDPED